MADKWIIRGDYFETCNCDYLCPCIYTNMTAEPTYHTCKAAIAMRINEGNFGGTSLDGVVFVVMAMVDGPMANGNWTVGLIIDEGAGDDQVAAIGAICSGDAGGPMEVASALVSNFAGIERAAIEIDERKMGFSLKAGSFLDNGADAVVAAFDPDQPLYIDNTAHPASKRLALARATHTKMNVFGIEMDNPDGGNNGHYAPFEWQGEAAV